MANRQRQLHLICASLAHPVSREELDLVNGEHKSGLTDREVLVNERSESAPWWTGVRAFVSDDLDALRRETGDGQIVPRTQTRKVDVGML